MKSVNQHSSSSHESGSAMSTVSEEGPESHLFSGFELISKTRAVFRKEVAMLSLYDCTCISSLRTCSSHDHKAHTNKTTALSRIGALTFRDKCTCVVDIVIKYLIICHEEKFILYYSSHQELSPTHLHEDGCQ
jgi:hypothetical protein